MAVSMCVLHLTCESTCRGRYRGPWISPALLDLVNDSWRETLARNLATAAALCAAWNLGTDGGARNERGQHEGWAPGCGRLVPCTTTKGGE